MRHLVFLALGLSFSANAVDYNSADTGDNYYLSEFGGKTEIVLVEKKLGNELVKVRYTDNSVEILKASRLKTKDQLFKAKLANFAGGLVIGMLSFSSLFVVALVRTKGKLLKVEKPDRKVLISE